MGFASISLAQLNEEQSQSLAAWNSVQGQVAQALKLLQQDERIEEARDMLKLAMDAASAHPEMAAYLNGAPAPSHISSLLQLQVAEHAGGGSAEAAKALQMILAFIVCGI